MLKRHAHCHDARTNGSVVGDLITYDGAGCGIDDKPNVSLDAADFDVGFIGGERGTFFVRVGIHEGLDAYGCSLAVVCNHLVGNGDAVEVFQGLGCFTERKAKVNVQRQAKGHDVGVIPAELQG